MEIVEAAKPLVDVLSFQDFQAPGKNLAEWHARTGKPVLWADGAKNVTAKDPATGEAILRNDGQWYAEALQSLRNNPGCIGAHLCGAYLRNRTRKRGLRDERECPDQENLALISLANRDTAAWVQATVGTQP
jgi:hypothetical protein